MSGDGEAGTVNVHATAIRIGGLGILVRGPSRSGKSSLALATLRRAEAAGLDAALVSDDQVFLEQGEDGLDAVAPAAIAGRIEISGVGILEERFVPRARLGLVVDLLDAEEIERLPSHPTTRIRDVELPRILLSRREASLGADILVSLAKRPDRTDLNQF